MEFKIQKDRTKEKYKIQKKTWLNQWVNCGKPTGETETSYVGIYDSYKEAELKLDIFEKRYPEALEYDWVDCE